jgi:hypothetical protein
VFVHFDWSGKFGDDMSRFARMNEQTRERTLRRLHAYFTEQDVAFFLPLQAPLPAGNGGCHGAKDSFYSASATYSCADEDVINDILNDQ